MFKQQSIDIRDYLMVTLTYLNCLMASNLMNISLDDVSKIKKHEEIDGAWVLTNDAYKTSMIYGAKIILLDSILLDQLKIVIKYFREEISNDSKIFNVRRYVFTWSREKFPGKVLGTRMDHSALANAMASSFQKAKVFLVFAMSTMCC